jgi:osomolarity two-component system phosphorelay intermediate protein YPD1
METFSQILEMDEPDDHEFSQSIVYGFFDQAETTFEEMDTAGYVANLRLPPLRAVKAGD